ncbi:MAG: signal peptidase I [Deltaproteobacteria bacterium]|nr:signal peptidase I [Deltaproteobacteria bacterium]
MIDLAKTDIKKKGIIREYAEAIAIALVLALFIRTFFVQAFKIPSASMRETLVEGDHILVNKFIYGIKIPFTGQNLIPISNPKPGDVIVFVFPMDRDKDFIKRVVAVEGDTVQLKDKKVLVNGIEVSDPHAQRTDPQVFTSGPQEHRDNMGPITVPKGQVFVMGDNRDHSYDSRFWGGVELKDVKGKAFLIYWSWNSDKFGVRWDRLGKIIR